MTHVEEVKERSGVKSRSEPRGHLVAEAEHVNPKIDGPGSEFKTKNQTQKHASAALSQNIQTGKTTFELDFRNEGRGSTHVLPQKADNPSKKDVLSNASSAAAAVVKKNASESSSIGKPNDKPLATLNIDSHNVHHYSHSAGQSNPSNYQSLNNQVKEVPAIHSKHKDANHPAPSSTLLIPNSSKHQSSTGAPQPTSILPSKIIVESIIIPDKYP